MPTLSLSYVLLPNHRNIWKEPAASILDPKGLHHPFDPVTGEANEESRDQKIADQAHFWAISRTLQLTHPRYLAGSGASGLGTMPGISTHTELELLVRLGLTPREALAAATSNYSEQFGWHELGLVEAGRRADLLILAGTSSRPDGRHLQYAQDSLFKLDGAVLDRAALLNAHR